MIIAIPTTVTDATLISTNIVENDAAEWVSGTTYAKGAEVMRTVAGTHSVYVSLQDSNAGNTPEADNLVTPIWWARKSATNRWAMFSNQINDQSERTDLIDFTVQLPALINAVAMFGLDGTQIQITVTVSGEGVVYDEIFSLSEDSNINNWYAYFFEPVVRQDTFANLGLPQVVNAEIRIRITNTGALAKVGLVAFGTQRELGVSNFGTSVGIIDYSRKERDTFGNPVVVQRNFSRRANYQVSVETNFVDSAQSTLASLRTQPMTFIGDPNRPETVVYGFFKDFDILLQNYSVSMMNISVEGLT